MTILELYTGLFPDADTVAASVSTRGEQDHIIHLDINDLKLSDTKRWDTAVTAILHADLVVTL
ncbi:hypothetical protein V5T82_04465 [Magnetovibrio sp. PR-2]|uniref:hypothetical protein n=1 Tax=Magnetovibrio sp. PR-2 TaxID=3120356 RepID=UPI002FCDF027